MIDDFAKTFVKALVALMATGLLAAGCATTSNKSSDADYLLRDDVEENLLDRANKGAPAKTNQSEPKDDSEWLIEKGEKK